ncbi:MAG: hypothetical protein ABI875_03515 [Gemmatimonadales bacterium]
MTTPIENERAAASRQPQIYEASVGRAKPGTAARPRSRVLRATEGAALGVVFWLLLFTLGVPWVFHIGSFDGMLPSAIVGAVLGLTRWRWVPLATVVALVVMLVIVAYTPIITGRAHSLVRNDPLPAGADAIMVLSAGTNDDGTISPSAVDRLLSGLDLYKRGIAPVLMVSREAYFVNGHVVTSRADQERIISLSPDMRNLREGGSGRDVQGERVARYGCRRFVRAHRSPASLSGVAVRDHGLGPLSAAWMDLRDETAGGGNA